MNTMTVSVDEARKTAEEFVAENRLGAHVDQLLEDEQDYFVQLKLDDGTDHWPIGWAFIFVSKATGKLYELAPGDGVLKLDNMH